MNQQRVNFRLLENIHRVVLDQSDEIVNLKKELDTVRGK